MKYNILDATKDIIVENSCDPESKYFNTVIKNFDTAYVIPEDFHSQLKDHIYDGLSFPRINIRSIDKNFGNCKLLLSSLGFTFSIKFFSETWQN